MFKLSPRERCLRAVEHEEVDKIPTVFRARPEVVTRLEHALNVKGFDRVCEALGVDVRFAPGIALKGGYLPGDVKLKEGPYAPAYTVRIEDGYEIRRDLWGVESKWAPGHTFTYAYVSHPLQHIDLEEYRWPEVDEESWDAVARYRQRHEDYFVYSGVIHLFEIAWQLTGFNEFIVMMRRSPSTVNKILDKLDEIRFKQAKLLLEAGVDVIYDGDDVGAQNTMLISPQLWRKFLKPRYAHLARLVKRGGAKFFFHSDGWIEPIIPDLVEIGVDILNPVQPEAMDPARLKKAYGDALCFEGTISIQRTLPFRTPEEVEREVKERIETLGPTGLILGPTHAIQPDTPIENILALYRAVRKYGVFNK